MVESFAALGVMPSLVAPLAERGIATPFPVQQMAIPVALTGADLIGQARTGTGKTLAFGLPLLQRIVSPDEPDFADLAVPGAPQALVVTPTRELALQVATDLEIASSQRRIRVLTVYGGRAYEPQIEALQAGVEVVVGTPGRLLDLARQRYLDLSHVKVTVLDEADEMLDLGFLADVETILSMTPELRQSMLFSATMPSEVITLARRYMRHPVNIRAESPDETATVPTTAQFVYRAHRMDKDEVLARILQAENRGLAMLFARTKRQTQAIADELSRRGFSVGAVHGDLNQQARERALSAFRQGTVDVLVCTDVAARGIDVDGVTHVVNVTCPEDEKTYLHRIGRTGRAGASGVAITLVDWDDMSRWSGINTALGLPYPEPQETYSTSEHLYHDLGIPSGAGGSLASATGQASGGATRPRGRSRDRQGSTGPQGSAAAGGHGRRPRSRSRSRSTSRSSSGSGGERPTSGSPAAGSPSTDVPSAGAPSSDVPSSDARSTDARSTDAPGSTPGGGSQTSSEPSTPRRRRQRRRTRGGKPTDGGSD